MVMTYELWAYSAILQTVLVLLLTSSCFISLRLKKISDKSREDAKEAWEKSYELIEEIKREVAELEKKERESA